MAGTTYTLSMNGQQGVLESFTEDDTRLTPMKPGVIEKQPLKQNPAQLLMKASLGAPPAFYTWVADGANGRGALGSGKVAAQSPGSKGVVSMAEFTNAQVTEVDFPMLATAARDPLEFVVKATARDYRIGQGDGKAVVAPKTAKAQWLVSGYRLTLGTIDCREVDAINAFIVKPMQPLKLSLRTRGLTTEGFLRSGKPNPKAIPLKAPPGKGTLEGKLELLGFDGRTVIATLTLHDVAIEPQTGKTALGIAGLKGAQANVNLTVPHVDLAFMHVLGK